MSYLHNKQVTTNQGFVLILIHRTCVWLFSKLNNKMMTKGIIFTISVLMVAFSLWVMMMPIGIVLLFIGIPAVIRLRRTYLSSVGSIFLDTAAALLMGLGGTKVVIYSDDQSIVDSNKKGRSDCNLSFAMSNIIRI